MHLKKKKQPVFRLIFLCIKFPKGSCLIRGPVKTQQCFGKPESYYFFLEDGVFCLQDSTDLLL